MTKRSNAITRVIEGLDAKIETLRLAKTALLDEQQQQQRARPKATREPKSTRPAKDE